MCDLCRRHQYDPPNAQMDFAWALIMIGFIILGVLIVIDVIIGGPIMRGIGLLVFNIMKGYAR